MENKLEQLLNSLIEKGWNVFGHKDRMNAERCNYIKGNYYNFDNCGVSISLRELVSINSGLWQFVCENRMLNANNGVRANAVDCCLREILFNYDNYQYRIIESALCDEDKLEDFLLNSIKID